MLTTIREKTQGIIASFILLLIVIPFALWGINSYFERGSKTAVAEVNGIEITDLQFRQALDQLRGRVDPKALENSGFKRMVLDGMIDQTLLVQDAEASGYRLDDARLAALIRAQPYFQRDGQFDPELYRALLRREGLSVPEFERRLRDEDLTGQVQSGLAGSGIVTNYDVDQLVRLFGEERDVAYAVISPDAMRTQVKLEPQAVEAYYKAHPELFQIPEQVRVAYLRLSADDLGRHYEPTNEDIQKAYADEASRYVTPGTLRASHILIEAPMGDGPAVKKAEEKAAKIARELRDGANFATLAKKYSGDKASAAQGGDLGEIRPGMLPPELEAALNKMKPGEISGPIRTNYGFHIIKLTARTPEKRKPLAAVRKELVEILRKRYGQDRFYEMGDKFRDLVYEQPDGLVGAAKALGLDVQQSGWFTRSGGEGIAADPRVVAATFNPDVLSKARNSDAIDVGNDALVAVHVIDHKPAVLKPLAEVRAQIEVRLRDDQARELAQKAADAYLTELGRGGERLEALARSRHLSYHAARMIRRDDRKVVDARVVQEAFRLARPAKGDVSYGEADLGVNGVAVVAVDSVRDGDVKTADSTLLDRARRLLTTERGAGFYDAYRRGLRQQAKIRIYNESGTEGQP
jgi:peptidyl-prolyl cis-trans isomerase D